MAKRNGPGIWIVVASVVVLSFVGMLFLNDQYEEETASDIVPGMQFEDALETTRSSCYGATGRWGEVAKAGDDDTGIPTAMKMSRRCEQNASEVLAQIPAGRWANSHCKALVEGWRDLARWEVEHGPTIYNLDPSRGGMVSDEVRTQALRSQVLMGSVRYHYEMCVHDGVVG